MNEKSHNYGNYENNQYPYDSNRTIEFKDYKDNVFTEGDYYKENPEITEQINRIRNTSIYKNPFNVKVNINNNYYNSNVEVKHQTETGFFNKVLGLLFPNDTKPKPDNNNSFSINNTNNFSRPATTSFNKPSNNLNLPKTRSINKITHYASPVKDNSNSTSTSSNYNNYNRTRPTNTRGLTRQVSSILVPCMNCDQLIPFEEIESHSETCNSVKVKKEDKVNNCSFISINEKLKKLSDSIKKNLDNTNLLKEEKESINKLLEYVNKVYNLNELNHDTLIGIKNAIAGIGVLINKHNGKLSKLILIERAKILSFEKYDAIKVDIRKVKVTEMSMSITNKKNNSGIMKQSVRDKIRKELEREREIELEKKELKEKKLKEKKLNEIDKEINKNKSQDYTNSEIVNDVAKSRSTSLRVKPNTSRVSEVKSTYRETLKPRISDFNEIDHDFDLDDSFTNEQKNGRESRTNFIHDIDSDVGRNKSDLSEYSMSRSDLRSLSQSRDPGSSSETEFKNSRGSGKFKLGASKFDAIDKDGDKNYESYMSSGNENVNPNKNEKSTFRDFAKIVLKVKFEKMSSTHRGQKVPERMLYNEIKSNNIPFNKWTEFCLNEMTNNPQKYLDAMDTKSKSNSRGPRRLDVIDEEK